MSFLGRPNLTPRSRARFLPSPVLAAIRSRSKSASPPRTVSMRERGGLVVSIQASFNGRKLLADFTGTDRSAGMCFILSHGAALETASCDLSTLSASNGDERTQTGGAEAAQGNQIQR